MLEGEDQQLSADRAKALSSEFLSKAYNFQVRNDDGLGHFRRISREHPELCFVLVFGDPSTDDYGSYLIRNGRSRVYRVPNKLKEQVWGKHGVVEEVDEEAYEDWRFWEASWELMDVAETRWRQAVLMAIDARCRT